LTTIGDIITSLLSNPIGTGELVIGVTGIVLATFFYYRGRKGKKPRYEITSYNIIRDFEAESFPLEILYSGQRVENVTVSKVAFWNAGEETLNEADVASADPLTFQVTSGCKILDAKIISTKNESNKMGLEKLGESCYRLKFEFMDKDEGAVVQLVHTGKSSDDVCVCGTIKGAGHPKTRQRSPTGITVAMLFLLIGGGTVLFVTSRPPFLPTTVNGVTAWPYANPISVPLFLMIIFFLSSRLWNRYQRERFPKGFSAFGEEIVSKSKAGIRDSWPLHREPVSGEPDFTRLLESLQTANRQALLNPTAPNTRDAAPGRKPTRRKRHRRNR
jgi:hypothetical protein